MTTIIDRDTIDIVALTHDARVIPVYGTGFGIHIEDSVSQRTIAMLFATLGEQVPSIASDLADDLRWSDVDGVAWFPSFVLEPANQ